MEKDFKEESPSSIYLMHKYWGKKPSIELKKQINKYSKKNEWVFDPFAGYGGLGIEAMIEGRNVILNDLNPVSNFINKSILEKEVNIDLLKNMFIQLKNKYSLIEKKWYYYKNNEILTILRQSNDVPVKIKIYNSNKKTEEVSINKKEANEFLNEENSYRLTSWYPKNKLIQNSRICSDGKMKVCDLFSKRELICHAKLFELINQLDDCNEKELLLFAFTSNVANCSKLVPPIKTRGEMSQGAWMTGFYIGDVYLENNVFHYFENRVNKIIKGKEDYLKICNYDVDYKVMNEDAKKLSLQKDSIDFVFTDFPYGDTVPYFEQSQIWNAWLKNDVDYDNEIVVSDSKERNKDSKSFQKDIDLSISEICRVLKKNKYFTFTFHSLSGNEWEAIFNAILKHPFELVDFNILVQKTYTPRQLNRKQSIKGDIVVTYKKIDKKQCELNFETLEEQIENVIKKKCKRGELYDTNSIILVFVECLLKSKQPNNNIDFEKLINEFFTLDKETNKWFIK